MAKRQGRKCCSELIWLGTLNTCPLLSSPNYRRRDSGLLASSQADFEKLKGRIKKPWADKGQRGLSGSRGCSGKAIDGPGPGAMGSCDTGGLLE